MKVLNVCSNFDPVTGGGEAERTFQMSLFLIAAGEVCKILTIDTGLSIERKNSIGNGGVIAVPCLSQRFYIPKISFGHLRKLVIDADVVHLIGHWTLLNMMVYIIARNMKKPYVICPAGALSIFGRSKILKVIYDQMIGNKIIKNASRCIAVTKEERRFFISRGVLESKIEVIPNGISEIEFVSSDVSGFRDRFGLGSRPFILFVGRLNAIKGPDLLLEGFYRISHKFPNLELVFIGPDGGLLSELIEFTNQHGLVNRVHFLGYLGGAEKSNAFHAAELLVIPSRHEAMSIVALEAGMCGTPVLLTDQCGFDELAASGCGWVVSANAEGIQEGLLHVFECSEKLSLAATKINNFVKNLFSWGVIVERYRDVYARLLATRVLIVSQYFWPESFRINAVVETLVKKGVVVDVLSGKPNYPEGEIFPGYRRLGIQTEKYFGAKILRVPIFLRGKSSGWKLALNYSSFILSALLIAPLLLRRRRYDAIFVYGVSPIFQAIPALFLGWCKSSRVIVWVQDLWPESLEATGYVRNRRVLGWVELMVRFIYRHADLLLVQSKGFMAPVGALASGTPVAYFPNSVESTFCDVSNVPLPDIPALDEGFSVMFAGNVGVGQAVEIIVEAATLLKDHPDIRFVVLGQGSRWDWMCEQVKKRGLTNLHLPGRYPVETMPGLMQKASALLVSLADQPIFAATVPNKLQAYLAAGRPILACLNGEGARLVDEAEAGFAVPAEDALGLVAAVLRLHEMPIDERVAMGANGRRYFKEHFDHDQLTDELIGHFKSFSTLGKGVR
jgi:glycosyltransferase involved in cell wall biosynthesis